MRELSRLRVKLLLELEGLGRTLAILRTSPTTLEKCVHGLPMLAKTVTRLEDRLDRALVKVADAMGVHPEDGPPRKETSS